MDVFISKLTGKSQTVIPQGIRDRLKLGPGDHIRYRLKGMKVEIEKISNGQELKDDPFMSFTEWASDEDEKAMAIFDV